MWTDTHIHLDAAEFGGDIQLHIDAARALGVTRWILPSEAPSNFDKVRSIAHANAGVFYALGIHPMYVKGEDKSEQTNAAHSVNNPFDDSALELLQSALETHKNDPKLVAVGEIGLDFFNPNQTFYEIEQQHRFFKAQLKLASRYDLPVLLHVRRSVDEVCAALRKQPVVGGIAHAFNGSAQQAQALMNCGMALGFGGAATYTRALQIRERLRTVPDLAIVLETDGPDIPPAWLPRGENAGDRINFPENLARIGHELATVRGMAVHDFAALTQANAARVLPKAFPAKAFPPEATEV